MIDCTERNDKCADGGDRQSIMTTSDKLLVILLRFPGVTALCALGAVFMPLSWMVAAHRWA